MPLWSVAVVVCVVLTALVPGVDGVVLAEVVADTVTVLGGGEVGELVADFFPSGQACLSSDQHLVLGACEDDASLPQHSSPPAQQAVR